VSDKLLPFVSGNIGMLSPFAAWAPVEDAVGMGGEERGRDLVVEEGGSDAYRDEEEEDSRILAAEPAVVGEACQVDVH
jgi:hypothetical protein